jgi:hypothetical protein
MHLVRLLRPLAGFLVVLALSGCESAADRALRNSPDFKAGYSDGCSSAGSRGANPRDTGVARDEEAFRTNRGYRTGWGTGFNACRSYEGPAGPTLPGQNPF